MLQPCTLGTMPRGISREICFGSGPAAPTLHAKQILCSINGLLQRYNRIILLKRIGYPLTSGSGMALVRQVCSQRARSSSLLGRLWCRHPRHREPRQVDLNRLSLFSKTRRSPFRLSMRKSIGWGVTTASVLAQTLCPRG